MVRATWKLYAFLSGSWYDLTNDIDAPTNNVMGNTDCERGIRGNGPLDFVASTGTLAFDLNNYTVEGKYTYGHANALAGWKIGVKVKQVFTFDGRDYVRYRGVVRNITDLGSKEERKHVICVDWMEYAAEHKIDNPGFLPFQRSDQVVDTVLDLMPIPPQATDLETGISLFPATFDTVTSHTTAADEIVKAALSEIAHAYLRADRYFGETLVLENMLTRNGMRELTEFIVPSTDAGFLLKANSSDKLLKAGGGGRLLLNTRQTLDLNDSASVIDYDVEDGENIINYFEVYAVPRRKDSVTQTLFRLNAPIEIAAGETVVIKGTYADPNGGLPINANPDDMINPVVTTDYRAFVNDDGTGTEFTADLVVTPSFGTNGFEHEVFNDSTENGYITLFNVRGLGVYTYNQISAVAQNSASQNEFGIRSESMTQKYKNNLVYGRIYASRVVDEEKDQRTVLNQVYMTANKNTTMMQAFLCLDIGDLVRIRRAKDNIDSWYFIQGMTYQTMPGGHIMFSWIVKEFLSLALGLSLLGIEFSGGVTQDAVHFGYLPNVYSDSTPKTMSVSIWFKRSELASSGTLLAFSANGGGWRINSNGAQIAVDNNLFKVAPALWFTGSVVSANAWQHVLVVYDITSTSNVPVVYVNGSSASLSVLGANAGAAFSKAGVPLIIGNVKTKTEDYDNGFTGIIAEARVYHVSLTAADATDLYNAGVNGGADVLRGPDDGLVFQAFAVPSKRLSTFVNAALSTPMKLWDAYGFTIGTPVDSPTGKAIP